LPITRSISAACASASSASTHARSRAISSRIAAYSARPPYHPDLRFSQSGLCFREPRDEFKNLRSVVFHLRRIVVALIWTARSSCAAEQTPRNPVERRQTDSPALARPTRYG